LTTIAAVVLVAGCGGGSGKKSAGTVPVSGFSRMVSAKSGAFRTVVPIGFTRIVAAAQYQAAGPEEDGVTTSLVVIREPVRDGDINAVASRTLSAVRHQPGAHDLSRPSALSVGGQPALALDYAVSETGREWDFRQVFVRYGAYVYYIRETSLPPQYAVALSAFEELLSNWQWQ
jgi:hypothetical protein